MLKQYWWKLLSFLLLLYAVTYGFYVSIPETMILQTMRNLFYHVGMWFGMFTMLTVSFIYSLRYLKGFREENDRIAIEAVNVGLMFGFLGIFTGMVWANFTWGAPWVKDPKLNGAAVGLVVYLAYIILRSSVEDRHKRAKVSAVYNIFAFVLWIIFVMILPRLAGDSLHPATGNNSSPVLPMQLDPSMRTVFYPAMIGWILLGTWILQVRIRVSKLKQKLEEY
ncbi:MAG: cytochrome c biogenesis protein CcsA [Bacteroidetes bacterium]|nr:cytochrome c biogenesis protein CcsA [Bacteroidota bacterium]